MNFYHNLITKKSWQLLQSLRKRYEFILIGGWAEYSPDGEIEGKALASFRALARNKVLREAQALILKGRIERIRQGL